MLITPVAPAHTASSRNEYNDNHSRILSTLMVICSITAIVFLGLVISNFAGTQKDETSGTSGSKWSSMTPLSIIYFLLAILFISLTAVFLMRMKIHIQNEQIKLLKMQLCETTSGQQHASPTIVRCETPPPKYCDVVIYA